MTRPRIRSVMSSNGIVPDSTLKCFSPRQRTTRCIASNVKVMRRSAIIAKRRKIDVLRRPLILLCASEKKMMTRAAAAQTYASQTLLSSTTSSRGVWLLMCMGLPCTLLHGIAALRRANVRAARNRSLRTRCRRRRGNARTGYGDALSCRGFFCALLLRAARSGRR